MIYLVRHAHAVWTPDENRPLSARGAAGAERVAEVLGRCQIAALYASPAARAQQTLVPLAARLGLPIGTVHDLRERELGSQPVPESEFEATIRALWQAPGLALPGGESNDAAERRGVDVVRSLRARHGPEPIVLGTHGNLLALILHGFDPSIGFDFWQALSMPDIYALAIDEPAGVLIRREWRSA